MQENKEYGKWFSKVAKDGRMLENVPDGLRDDRMCAAAIAACHGGDALPHVPEAAFTEELCRLFGHNPDFTARVPDRKMTEQMLSWHCFALGHDGGIGKLLGNTCFPYEKREKAAVRFVENALPGGNLGKLPSEWKTREACLAAVSHEARSLADVPPSFRDAEICLHALTSKLMGRWPGHGITWGGLEKLVPEGAKTEDVRYILDSHAFPESREAALAVVRRNGLKLSIVPMGFRDAEVCHVAVTSTGMAVKHIPPKLLDKDMLRHIAARGGWALADVPVHLLDEEICLIFAQVGGMAWYIPEHLRTKAVCKSIVLAHGEALQYVPEELRTEELCRLAVKTPRGIPYNGNQVLRHVPEKFRTRGLCLSAVQRDGLDLKAVPMELRDAKMCQAALASFPKMLRRAAYERWLKNQIPEGAGIVAMLEADPLCLESLAA